MRISKEHADKYAREFRAGLNKAAKDGLIHEFWFAAGKYTVGFKLLVNKPKSKRDLCFTDCPSHGSTSGWR